MSIKQAKLFFPDDIEFDLTPIGLKKYIMPGNIPTEKMIKLMALEEKVNKKQQTKEKYQETIKDIKDLIGSMFSENHSEEEIKKLKSKASLQILLQIVNAMYKQMLDQGAEAKNMKTPEKTGEQKI